MTLYKNKYRVESARLPGWDYSSPGYYFITIVTKNREYLFGDIIDGGMVLSVMGEIIKSEWLKSFDIRSELSCDEYCIMPNHIHAIVVIRIRRDARPCVSTDTNNDGGTILKRSPRSISSFVAGFKSSATKKINELRHTPRLPIWQPRFHDRVIRDENELRRIRQYIVNNPEQWEKDNNYVLEDES